MSVHDLLNDILKRNYYLTDNLNWVLFVATRTKGCCKWNSYNSNVFVEGFCSSWSRHYVCIKSALLHSYYSHNVISVLIEEFFLLIWTIIPTLVIALYLISMKTWTNSNNSSILKKRLILLKYLWLQILMGTEAPTCRILSRYRAHICGSS